MHLRHSKIRGGAAALTLSAALVAGSAAAARASDGSTFAGDTTALRGAHGLAAYRECGDLDAVAVSWARHEAGVHALVDNPDLGDQVAAWQTVGENDGEGPDAQTVQGALQVSPPHLANLLSPAFTEIGIGTARSSDGILWVDEVFRRPAGAGCAAAAAAPPPVTVTSASHAPAPAAPAASPPAAPGATSRSETRAAIPTAAQRAAVAAAARPRLLAAQRAAVASRLPSAHGAQDVVGDALAFARLMSPVR